MRAESSSRNERIFCRRLKLTKSETWISNVKCGEQRQRSPSHPIVSQSMNQSSVWDWEPHIYPSSSALLSCFRITVYITVKIKELINNTNTNVHLGHCHASQHRRFSVSECPSIQSWFLLISSHKPQPEQ